MLKPEKVRERLENRNKLVNRQKSVKNKLMNECRGRKERHGETPGVGDFFLVKKRRGEVGE